MARWEGRRVKALAWEGRRRPLFGQEEEEVIEEVEEKEEEVGEAIFEAFCPTSSPTLSVISLSSNPPTVQSPEYSSEIHFVIFNQSCRLKFVSNPLLFSS